MGFISKVEQFDNIIVASRVGMQDIINEVLKISIITVYNLAETKPATPTLVLLSNSLISRKKLVFGSIRQMNMVSNRKLSRVQHNKKPRWNTVTYPSGSPSGRHASGSGGAIPPTRKMPNTVRATQIRSHCCWPCSALHGTRATRCGPRVMPGWPRSM
jgi:hypothetical protein